MTNIERGEIRLSRDSNYHILRVWLSELSQFYDGHEGGKFIEQLVGRENEDELGYFTIAKEIYVLREEERPVGAICLNYKRGEAVKVGPFVVSPIERGKGLGIQLLQFAEKRAREKGKRKIYATTSHLNIPVNRIFQKCGFLIEAKFPDQYKVGSTELIWGKFLQKREHIPADLKEDQALTITERGSEKVQIVDYSDDYYELLKELILDKLSQWHNDIDEDFVRKMILGHFRGTDFEKKGKVILLAISEEGLHGCSVVVPKRGNPAKLYPLLGTEQAQKKLIEGSELVAKEIGCHKIYTFSPVGDHIQQTLLESLGYTPRGVLAEPYKPRYDLMCFDKFLHLSSNPDKMENNLMNREGNPKTLWIKRQFLEEILAGRKTLEVRVGYGNIRQLKPGIQLLLNEEYPVRIKAIRRYDSFERMIAEEDAEKIVPGREKREVLQTLKALYPPFKEKLGVFVIELET